MEVAHRVLGPLAPEKMATTTREGAPVELLEFAGMGEALTHVADALSDLFDREPNAGVAVLTRFAYQANEAYRLLEKQSLPHLNRVNTHEFSFRAGVEVAEIAQTKGLEFDYVILLGIDEDSFPEDVDLSRHLLHIGLTRAAHQAWLVSWGRPAAILPDDVKRISLR